MIVDMLTHYNFNSLNLPEGYTLGWNNGGSNLHFGGLDG